MDFSCDCNDGILAVNLHVNTSVHHQSIIIFP